MVFLPPSNHMLKSYFQKSAALDERKSSMVRKIRDFSYVITGNELEALVLEANLIKQYKPHFNIILRDDKNYPYLKLTTNEEWPRLEVVRKIKKDGSLYFGPYIPAGGMWEALSFIRKNFHLRPCRYALDKPIRPCVQYQMGRCPAPCAGFIGRDEYLKTVEDVRLFLAGKKKNLLAGLEERMERFSEELRFEDAARIRKRQGILRLKNYSITLLSSFTQKRLFPRMRLSSAAALKGQQCWLHGLRRRRAKR